MIVWLIAVVVTAGCCAALYYAAARGPVNAGAGADEAAPAALYRTALAELERDLEAGTIGRAEAEAARAEIGRELLRQKAETDVPGDASGPRRAWSGRRLALFVGPLVAVTSLASYAVLGSPSLPAQPAAARPEVAARTQLMQAVADVEARLNAAPDDVAGWRLIAPVYMRLGRYADAVGAFRKLLELEGDSADRQTDLAEALMAREGGSPTGEALALLRAAAAADPTHVRSRYYLAIEATHARRLEEADTLWRQVIALSNQDDPWMDFARRGLAFVATARAEPAGTEAPTAQGLAGPSTADVAAAAALSDEERDQMIASMVEGLAARLAAEGGSVAEWAQLIRARMVQGDEAQARRDLEAALADLTDPAARDELTGIAAGLGLTADEGAP
jgi:cytochrome c-type biogenesis protein CcmH